MEAANEKPTAARRVGAHRGMLGGLDGKGDAARAARRTCPSTQNESIADWRVSAALLHVHTAHDLAPFARACGYEGEPFRWDPERRFELRCQLDAAFFHLYGIARDDVDYIMDTFPIVRRNDEKAHGTYRTKTRILALFDDYAQGPFA